MATSNNATPKRNRNMSNLQRLTAILNAATNELKESNDMYGSRKAVEKERKLARAKARKEKREAWQPK